MLKLPMIFFFVTAFALHGFAGVESSVVGTVTDSGGVAIENASVELLSESGQVLKKTVTSATGEYSFFPITFGNYKILVESSGRESVTAVTQVMSDRAAQVDIQLITAAGSNQRKLRQLHR